MAPENGHDDGEGNQHTVFVDTSLDTHLATIVSDADTVSDLKNKIMLEHRQCFPAIGDIKIDCLKVKRRGNYYHLSDSMLVKSAFVDDKKIWFLSVDASHLEKQDGVQHFDKQKAGDQLALPWVTNSRSIDRHDSHEDGPSKVSLFHGSPSMPFVNQKVPSVEQFTPDDSCKKISKNIEEDRSSNDNECKNLEPDSEKQLDSKVEENLYSVNKEIQSKKRIRDVHDEGSLEDDLGSGPSLKKKRKTQKTEGNVKSSEEDRVLTDDTATLDDVVTKAVNDEHTKTTLVSLKKIKKSKKGKKVSAHDELAIVVRSSVEDVGEETCPQKNMEASEVIPDVEMAVEKNIQQEMPLQLSSDNLEENIREHTDNLETHVGASGCEHEDQLLDNLVVDISSAVPTPVFDEKIIDEQKNEMSGAVLEKTLKDDLIAVPTESHRSLAHKEKSRKESGKTKKRSVLRNGEPNDAATITKEETYERQERQEITSIDALHIQVDNDNARKTKELNAECINENPEKQNEKLDGTRKKSKKKKTKKSAARNEDEPLTKHGNGDLCENEKEGQSSLPDAADRKDVSQAGDKVAEVSDEGLVKETKKNPKSSDLTEPEKSRHHLPEEASKNVTESQVFKGVKKPKKNPNSSDLPSEPEKSQHLSSEETSKNVTESQVFKGVKKPEKNPKSSDLPSEPEKSHHHLPEEASKNVTVSQVSKGEKKPEKSPKSSDLPSEPEKSQHLFPEETSKNAIVSQVSKGVKNPEKNPKSLDQPSEPEKSQHLFPEEISKNVTVSQVSKGMDDGKHEADNPDEINFKHYFTPGGNLKKKGAKKKPNEKDDSRNDHSVNEKNKALLTLKKAPEVSKDGVKDQNIRNIDNFKTPKPILKFHPPKNSTPVVRSLLNTHRSIFRIDSDDSSADDNAAVNSDSSTRAPSSSEESASSIDSRRHGSHAVKRKESDGKNNMNSQSRKVSMADLLRSSSRFKKARVSASQQVKDTESETVDFVPESQPRG